MHPLPDDSVGQIQKVYSNHHLSSNPGRLYNSHLTHWDFLTGNDMNIKYCVIYTYFFIIKKKLTKHLANCLVLWRNQIPNNKTPYRKEKNEMKS